LFLFVTKPLTKGRRLAERNFGKNGEPTPKENPEAPTTFCASSRKINYSTNPFSASPVIGTNLTGNNSVRW
jgi:hypothetical protein